MDAIEIIEEIEAMDIRTTKKAGYCYNHNILHILT